MFLIQNDQTICLTRGDAANIVVTAKSEDGAYTFVVGDVVRFKILERRNVERVVLQKDVVVSQECESITIALAGSDTKIGGVISVPTDYWYEVELNPDTYPQTIVGYDVNGEKVFRLYPEGGDING